MTAATRADVVRLLPGVQDHTVLEILATRATVGDLEAALRLLQDEDEDLVEIKQERGSRLNRLVAILERSELGPQDERE